MATYDKRKKEETAIAKLLRPPVGQTTKSNGRLVKKTNRRAALQKVLQVALKTNFRDPTEAQRFEGRYKKLLISKDTPYLILHELAKKEIRPNQSDEKAVQFLNWVLQKFPELLEKKDEHGYSALHKAMMENNTVFVDAVLQNEAVVNLGVVLEQTCQYGNSLHVAIRQRLPLINLMISKCSEANQVFMEEQLDSRNTPLHLYMSHNELDSGAESDLDEFDEDEYSESYDSDKYDASNHNNINFDEDEHGEKEKEWVPVEKGPGGIRTITRLEPETPTVNRPIRTRSFPVAFRDEKEVTDSVLETVKLLIKKQPSVLWKTNAGLRTPYQERIHQLIDAAKDEIERKGGDNTGDSDTYLRKLEDEDPIANCIRLYCVKKLSRDRTMASLYRPGQGMSWQG